MKNKNEWQTNKQESGWFVGCSDDKHDHDNPEELTTVHLLDLVRRFPGLFSYLAMPVGIQLLFKKSQVIVYKPDEEYGKADPEELITTLPF